jgi:hypothetical protein
MVARRTLVFGLAAIPLSALSVAPAVAGRTAARFLAIVNAARKVGVTLTASAVSGVVSAKVMKDVEHAHDDAPALHVVAYYSLVGNRRIVEASTFWYVPDQRQLNFLRTFEQLQLRDIKEVSKTPSRAAVWVSLYGNQVSRKPLPWHGTVYLVWSGAAWMIDSIQIVPGVA